MAEYRTVRMSFWHDPYIEELDAKAKLLYLYLFTSPYTNNLGILEATRKKISFETGLTVGELDKILSEFEQSGKVVCDHDHSLIFLCNFIKHQCKTSPKIMAGLMELAPAIPSPIIARAICIHYPEVYGVSVHDGDTLSIPYADGMKTVSIPTGEVGSWKLEVGSKEPDGSFADGKPSPPPCPHDGIREMYHEALPQLPRTVTWGKNRQVLLKARWRETWERLREKGQAHELQDLLTWWREYFARVRASPFLLGQVTGGRGKPFLADLEWLIRPENYAKVIDGRYLDRRTSA
ncbi:hypothetical protein LJC59_00170 [Desulfovibrio sp. OttesenSCG-928-A18]|nr:hypothetical protein [Desulfovibrio sp. OttesenSCG-928-A18]